jgi:hypothetical protein
MGEESTTNRAGADAKAKARIARYEKRKEAQAAAEAARDPNIKIVTFWEKIGKDGSWEEKEYRIKIKEK